MTQMTAAQEMMHSMPAKEIAESLKWMGKLYAVVAYSGIIEKIERICAELESGAITPGAAVNALNALRSNYWIGR